MDDFSDIKDSSLTLLQSIFDYMERLSKERDPERILVILADMGKDLIKADRCTLWLKDENGENLYTVFAHQVEKLVIPITAGLVGYSVRNNEEIIINDPYNDERFNTETDKATGYRTKEIVVIPIRMENGEIIGAFQALNKISSDGSDGVFTVDDLDALRLAASYAGRSFETAILNREIEATQREILVLLGELSEARSKETNNHVHRVAYYSVTVAKKLSLPENQIRMLELVSPMHDIGKLGIPDSVLLKAGKLTDEEFDKIKEHTTMGYNILSSSKRPIIKTASVIAYQHHERFDGRGYPQGLSGENIDILGRITAVCDVFDALTSERVYKAAWEINKAVDLLIEEKGKQFDPVVVDAFVSELDEIMRLKKEYRE